MSASDTPPATNPDDLFLKAVFEFSFAAPSPWYKDKQRVGGLVDAVAKLALFSELRLAGPEDKQKPFTGVEAARKLVANGRADVTYLQDGPDESRLAMVRIEPSEASLTLKVWCGGDVLQRQRATLLDQLSQLVREVREQLTGLAGLAYGYAYPVHDRMAGFVYPRPRPPRRHQSIQIYSVVEYLDLAFHRSGHADAALDGIEALLGEPLPEFATRREAGDLVELRWVADPGDEAELQRGATAHELWLATHLPTRIDAGFNAMGDAPERVVGDEAPQPPLTLYSPTSELGYKAVVVMPGPGGGKIEQGAWAAASSALAAGQLPDGQPLRAVKLIVPLRAQALATSARAKAAGFAAVLYPDDDGRYWDPDPPGLWAIPPRSEPV